LETYIYLFFFYLLNSKFKISWSPFLEWSSAKQ
jgi:hypothetical protein